MKVLYNKIILLVSGLLPHYFSYGQVPVSTAKGLYCEYILKYKTDSTSNSTKKELFNLFVSNGLSLFKSKASSSMDSLAAVYESLPFNEQNSRLMMQAFTKLPKPIFTYEVYKNSAEHSVSLYEKIGKTLYFYKEPANFLTWTITKESLLISGYKCQKATASLGGRRFEAWFTRDVPIADGPYKFYGLPGLIVEVHDSHQYYTFQLIKISSVPNLLVSPKPTQPATSTTKQQFLQGKATYTAGAIGRVESMGNVLTDSEKQGYRERLKRNNNPLEFK